jgi:hypothetical protein
MAVCVKLFKVIFTRQRLISHLGYHDTISVTDIFDCAHILMKSGLPDNRWEKIHPDNIRGRIARPG